MVPALVAYEMLSPSQVFFSRLPGYFHFAFLLLLFLPHRVVVNFKKMTNKT